MNSKNNFKKLALLGITGGIMLASPAVANDVEEVVEGQEGVLLAASCGGGGCEGKSGYRGQLSDAYNNTSNSMRNVPQDNLSNPSLHIHDRSMNDRSGRGMSQDSSSQFSSTSITISESDLMNRFTAEDKRVFQTLSPAGKALVKKAASLNLATEISY